MGFSSGLDVIKSSTAASPERCLQAYMTTTIEQLLNHFNLKEFYRISWATKFSEKRQGIYIVSTSNHTNRHNGITITPKLSDIIIQQWIDKLPKFQLDNVSPTLQTLKHRLLEFWLPDESILYIGKAPTRKNGSGISKRVREYFDTAIGDGRPHSGGQWIKVLSNISSLFIYYVPCDKPGEIEDKMLEFFMNNVSPNTLNQLKDKELPLPFANLRYKPSIDKKHGLKNQRL